MLDSGFAHRFAIVLSLTGSFSESVVFVAQFGICLAMSSRFAVRTNDQAQAMNDSKPRQVQRSRPKQRLRNEIMPAHCRIFS